VAPSVAPLDVDVLAALVAIALVAAVVAEVATGVPSSIRWRWSSWSRCGGGGGLVWNVASLCRVQAELAAKAD
jgi:Flp pilus assembly pilin Flp